MYNVHTHRGKRFTIKDLWNWDRRCRIPHSTDCLCPHIIVIQYLLGLQSIFLFAIVMVWLAKEKHRSRQAACNECCRSYRIVCIAASTSEILFHLMFLHIIIIFIEAIRYLLISSHTCDFSCHLHVILLYSEHHWNVNIDSVDIDTCIYWPL